MSLTRTDAAASKNALPKRRLGRTDMHITPVGLGAWAIGGSDWAVGWGSQDDAQSIAAIRHAIERGINWIDETERRVWFLFEATRDRNISP